MDDIETPARSTFHRPGMRRRVATAVLGLATGLAMVTGAPSTAQASTTAHTCVPTSHTTNWKSALADANAAMSKALKNIQHEHYAKAVKHLRLMKREARTANTAAKRLIGKPPTDPESDDPPGVAAVLKVSGLDHRITLTLVPLFSDPKGHHVIRPLGKGLNMVDACRDVMLGKVIALRPGPRDDYVDGLSDTLPGYQKELTALSTALAGDDLTPGGRSALEQAQQVVSATSDAMESVFGGGERSPLHR